MRGPAVRARVISLERPGQHGDSARLRGSSHRTAMAGRIKELIDEVFRVRMGESPALAAFVRAHLMLKGIHPDRFTDSSPDDPVVIARLEQMLADFRDESR
jgi:hypothetical protein